MNPMWSAILLTMALTAGEFLEAETVRLSTTGRDPGVSRWISYEMLGPRNYPVTIVYLSIQKFKTYSPEGLILLEPSRYDIISSYTQKRIAQNDCLRGPHSGDAWYTVKVTQHEKQTTACALPQRAACGYLANVVHLAGMQWTSDELGPIKTFISEVECNTIGSQKKAN